MTDNKLVIRRLPPSMSEEDFLRQVSPLPNHDYFCFFGANSGLGPHSYSRAYINFLDPNDMSIFRERFDNYIFLDKDGHEYQAVVEQSLWHKSPKNGPFYLAGFGQSRSSDEVPSTTNEDENVGDHKRANGILQDPEYIDFIRKLEAKKRGQKQSTIQTLETNLDALTNSTGATATGNKDYNKIVTPLIGFVNQKRDTKSRKAR